MKRFFVPFIIFILILNQSVGQSNSFSDPSSWAQIQKKGKGTIVIYWYESKPFIFRNSKGQMAGIEFEIMDEFARYLKKRYSVDLTVKWTEAVSFQSIYFSVRDMKIQGVFGASALSITPERLEQIDFAPPYMADISVLITSKNVPVVKDTVEFNNVFSHLTAITIKGTTYEKDLLAVRAKHGLDFPIRYIPSIENIQRTISAMDNAFGFIDLPVYLMELQKNASLNVNRQNFYAIKREGYAIMYTKNSDWGLPMSEYFQNPDFKLQVKTIVGKYLDRNVYQFVEDLFLQSDKDIALLTKEKEIQQFDLQGKAKQIEKEAILRNFLIVAVFIILIFLAVIYLLYQKGNSANIILSDQKEKIEIQRLDIEHKNERLEKRNNQLTQLNEEKNNLIKILAHDLRTPINHVHGLAQVFLLENKSLPAEQTEIINKIIDAALRLNKMIGKILDIDAVESNRVNVILEPVAVCSLVMKVINSFEKQSLKKDISLVVDKEVDEHLSIAGDPLYLTEVFENLISNALKFSPHGKKIWIKINLEGSTVQIKVKDEGPGLTSEDHEKLFQKFQRLSANPTDGERSIGLGLSIVKKYVELMNGRVGCESQAGRGATFFVEFPKI